MQASHKRRVLCINDFILHVILYIYSKFDHFSTWNGQPLKTCVGDIRNCLANNMLKLNETEVILFTSKHALKSSIGVTVGEQPVRS